MSFLFKPPGQKKEVMLLDPVSHRYTTLKVDTRQETEKIIYCKKHGGVLYRFFKLGPGWTEKDIRYLAVEGNPLVSWVKPEAEGGGYGAAGLEEYLRILWGNKAMDNMPAALKKSLEENTIGVTVTIAPLIPDEEDQTLQQAFDDIKAEGILYDADLDNLAKMGEAKEVKKWQDRVTDKVPWVLTGIALKYILEGLNILT